MFKFNKKAVGYFGFLLLVCISLTDNIPGQQKQQEKISFEEEKAPQKVLELIKNGVNLVEEQDKVAEGLAKLEEAIALAPNSVKAHSEYIRLKSYWQDLELEVRAEYEELMKKDPNNSLYPLALFHGQLTAFQDVKTKWLNKIAEIAPDAIWGKYAIARNLEQTDPDASLAVYLNAIDKDPTEISFYASAFQLLQKQKKLDEAATLLVKMRAQPVLKIDTLQYEWSWYFMKMGANDEAKQQLIAILKKLIQDSNDVQTLVAVRGRLRILNDEESIKAVDEKISRLDPTWYPQRGQVSFNITSSTGKMKRSYFAGRQNQLHAKLLEIGTNIDPQEQIQQAEKFLSMELQPSLREIVYNKIFGLAIKTMDTERAIKYGELLLKNDPENARNLIDLAKAYSSQKDSLKKAHEYSLKALNLTEEFHLVTEYPANIPSNTFKSMMSAERQKNSYNYKRQAVLNGRAFVLSAMNNDKEAEPLLQQSLKIKQTSDIYILLEKVLRKLGRTGEAEKAAAEGESLWRKEVLAGFTSEPIKDFELTTIKGEKVNLSGLKGKLVVINFWATWCVPCIKEMPVLVELYNKYKSQGLEILAISGDSLSDKPKVSAFALKNKLNFPVLYGEDVPALYSVNSYPTTIFIDRQGYIKYRSTGIDAENAKRSLEFIISELMKAENIKS